ncbi:MAG TPA: hypothetical protein V6C89_06315 [Drouetiella sp.]|jgi:hypothetical protein
MTSTTLPEQPETNATTNGAALSGNTTQRGTKNNWKNTALALTICFSTGLLLCWRTNFSHTALDVAPMFDSGKYISSTEMVMNAASFIHHFTYEEWKTICYALKEPLMMDGPVLPLLGAAWFTLIHKSPDLFDMRAALALQAILHAASACCMFLAAKRIFRDDKWALLTGLTWAALPSAVLGAGRFMTENITSTLLLLTACIVPSKLSDRCARSFALGMIAATVGLLKAALLPGILAGFIVAGFCLWGQGSTTATRSRRLLSHALSLAIGATIVLTPWLWFTKEATGSYSITAQREPVLNIVIGGNSENDGWSGTPETDFVKLYDTVNGDKAGTFLGIWQANFTSLSNIAIRRIARLWSCPWNDCLSKFSGLALPSQWLWHQLILSLAIFGGLLIAFKRSSHAEKLTSPIIGLGGTLLASHLIYIVFNSSPRQAFTSMPFVVLLASYAVFQTTKTVATNLQRKEESTKAGCTVAPYQILAMMIVSFLLWLAAVTGDFHSLLQSVDLERFAYLASWLTYAGSAFACTLAVVALTANKRAFVPVMMLQLIPAAILCAAFATSPREVAEWPCKLKQNTIVNRTVILDDNVNPDWATLVVDGDYGITRANIDINSKRLSETLAPLSTFTSNKNLTVNYSVFGGVSNKNPEQLRQWRAVSIPRSLLKSGENTISISSPAGDATIYGSFNRSEDGKLVAPTLSGFSGCKLLSETQPKLEARYNEPLTANALKGKCWRTTKNEDEANDLSPTFGKQVGQYRAFLCLGYDRNKAKSTSQALMKEVTLEPQPITISAKVPFNKRYAVPQELGKSTFVNVSVTGELVADDIEVQSRVDVRNMTNLGSDLNLPNSIKTITTKQFDLSGSLSRTSLDQPNEFFEVKFQSKRPVRLQKLQLKITACERPDFATAKVAVY